MPRREQTVAVADPEDRRDDEQDSLVERPRDRRDSERGERAQPAWEPAVLEEEPNRPRRPLDEAHTEVLQYRGRAGVRSVSVQQHLAVLLAASAVVLTAADAAEAARTPIPGIRSPSGNIACLFVPRSPSRLFCSIAHADYAAKLQAQCMAPNGAGVDWHGFELAPTRKGAVTCSGGILYSPGTQRPVYAVLPYGKSWHKGVFTCASRRTGVTCRNPGGHGLFIAREAWRVW